MLQTFTTLVAGVELVTELLSVAVLLMALDRLATAIRWTYNAGRFTGRIWFAYGLPALLWTADKISWLLAQIDWAETRDTVLAMASTITALAITTALTIRDWHRQWVGSIDWQPAPEPAAPAVNPLFPVAEELSSYSCRQLRSRFSLKLKTSKARLIAAALAY